MMQIKTLKQFLLKRRAQHTQTHTQKKRNQDFIVPLAAVRRDELGVRVKEYLPSQGSVLGNAAPGG